MHITFNNFSPILNFYGESDPNASTPSIHDHRTRGISVRDTRIIESWWMLEIKLPSIWSRFYEHLKHTGEHRDRDLDYDRKQIPAKSYSITHSAFAKLGIKNFPSTVHLTQVCINSASLGNYAPFIYVAAARCNLLGHYLINTMTTFGKMQIDINSFVK